MATNHFIPSSTHLTINKQNVGNNVRSTITLQQSSGLGTLKKFSGKENFKISGHFSGHETMQTRRKSAIKII